MKMDAGELFGEKTILDQREERLIGEAIRLGHAVGPWEQFDELLYQRGIYFGQETFPGEETNLTSRNGTGDNGKMSLMEQFHGLASLFLEGADGSWPLDKAELGRLLHRNWDLGREQWPEISLPVEVFVRHLARRWATPEEDSSSGQSLGELVARDFYLACACAHEVPAAVRTFERHYLARLPSYLQHMNQPQAFIDDVCQTLREKLLVRTAEEPPKIADYTGRGALMGWVRITALRMAVRLLHSRKDGEHENNDVALAALPSPGLDPELEVIKRTYQKEFLKAINDAFGSLSSEHRYLLRLYFVDRLSTTEMATLFRVNQSTISRRLQTARLAVYGQTKDLLKERLALSSREFHSLIQVVDSQLDMSLSRMLVREDEIGAP